MSHFKNNLRDIEFNLFEVFGTDQLLGRGAFADLDEATARQFLSEAARLAEGPIAASFADADRNPPVFDPGTATVVIPESFKASYRAWMKAEYWRLGLPVGLGGQDAPNALRMAIYEQVLGANPPVLFYATGPGFAGILFESGTADQKKIAQLMVDNGWGSTMVLTEPDAGSDVGAGRTSAVQQPDGSWHISGVKRFITSAVNDMVGNIIHLVLARPQGHRAGTKGLSLFMVPEWLFDIDTGELTDRNGVFVTNVEHKMGFRVSTTCDLHFGEDPNRPAKGWLVGEAHDGIAQMFQIIEQARMHVGAKAIATLSTGYLNALDFAKTRVQSSDLARVGDKSAPPVPIINHPDVRRSLMLNKAYAEGLRALLYYTAAVQDRIVVGSLEETCTAVDEAVNDLLLPIVKGAGSERAYEQLAHALQTFGGSGFLQDYPLEQYIRDAKIDTLYEGTTAIQGLDFFFRKIIRNEGKALSHIQNEIKQFLAGTVDEPRLAAERSALFEALENFEAMIVAMTTYVMAAQQDPGSVYKTGQNTTRLLLSAGDLLVGYLLARQASIALTCLDGGSLSAADIDFYIGKTAAARFFAQTVLPELSSRRSVIECADNSLMDVPVDAF